MPFFRVLVLRFLPPRRGRNRKAQAGGTPLAGSALGIRSEWESAVFWRCVFLPPRKGPKQESPSGGNPACGVGPGDPIRMRIRPALKGRNKILDHKPVLPLQGVAILNTRSNSQGGALGWHVAAPSGRNSRSATSKFARGGKGIARSRRHSIARNK